MTERSSISTQRGTIPPAFSDRILSPLPRAEIHGVRRKLPCNMVFQRTGSGWIATRHLSSGATVFVRVPLGPQRCSGARSR